MEEGRTMSRRYHTLAVREDGRWAPQFGDYDLETVEAERDDYRHGYQAIKARDLRIVTTGPAQADIDAAIARLNGETAK